jgi:hypothetical protein
MTMSTVDKDGVSGCTLGLRPGDAIFNLFGGGGMSVPDFEELVCRRDELEGKLACDV